ncbi:MAG TPA: type III-B CRISPR module RAMP protein Cmr4 [Desulfotomaculum sp.]|nr:type III-B CRISPR module RAMP protein Cmr4 [Desulfotomaculum sp.]
MEARLLFVHAFSPLHAGTGQAAGVIDLPVAREKATGLPYLPGSSLKGVLREACRDKDLQKKIFGPDTTEASEHAGSVQISDQRLLALPVRSLKATFAWVTSPYVLHRLLRDAACVAAAAPPPDVPEPASTASCLVSDGVSAIVQRDQVILEDLDLKASSDKKTKAWADWIQGQVFTDDPAWGRFFADRFCVLHDEVLSFLVETATEITARIRLREDAKTVEQGGLWYEEALPAETILSGLVVATPVDKVKIGTQEVFQKLTELINKPLQLGGKATVGRGLCRLRLAGGVSRANT